MTVYKKRDIDERLRALGATNLYKKGRDYYIEYKGVPIAGIVITHPGNEVSDYAVNKLARRISSIGNLDVSTIKKILTGREEIKLGNLERLATLTTGSFVALTLILVSLILIQQNILTGFAIANNLSNNTINFGIILCVTGILALAFYKMKRK